MSQQSVLTAIYEKINPATSSGTVFKTAFGGTDSIRGRIFQLQASQDTVLPLCIFAVFGEVTEAYLGLASTSLHSMNVRFDFYFRPIDGVATALASENYLFDLLHNQTIASADSDIASIHSLCESRGTPTILPDAVSISTLYRVIVSKKS